jgi:hypothetical protein
MGFSGQRIQRRFYADITTWNLKRCCGWFKVFNATFNNISVISWRLVLFGGGNRGPKEKHPPVARPDKI